MSGPGRRGRRGGDADTRADILDAARSEFARKGYEGASLRAIARAAGVDPALVHHWFAGRPALFAAVMDIPADPPVVVAGVLAAGRERVGEALVRGFLGVWDQVEGRERFAAIVTSASTHPEAGRVVREFLVHEIFGPIVRHHRPDASEDEVATRASFAAAQLIGIGTARYVLGLEPVQQADADLVAALVGPNLQRLLVEDLPGLTPSDDAG